MTNEQTNQHKIYSTVSATKKKNHVFFFLICLTIMQRYFLRIGRADGRPDDNATNIKFRQQYANNAPTGHGFVIGTAAHMRLHR